MKFVPLIRTLKFILTGLNIIIRDYDAEVVKGFGRNHRWWVVTRNLFPMIEVFSQLVNTLSFTLTSNLHTLATSVTQSTMVKHLLLREMSYMRVHCAHVILFTISKSMKRFYAGSFVERRNSNRNISRTVERNCTVRYSFLPFILRQSIGTFQLLHPAHNNCYCHNNVISFNNLCYSHRENLQHTKQYH